MTVHVSVHKVESVIVTRLESNGTHWLTIGVTDHDGTMTEFTLFHSGHLSVVGDLVARDEAAEAALRG